MRAAMGWVVVSAAVASMACGAGEDIEQAQLGLGGFGGSVVGGGGLAGELWSFRRGATIDSQPYVGVADATIRADLPNQGSDVYCISKGGSVPKRCLIRWDLSKLPTTATVRLATFDFYVTDPSNATFSLLALSKAWTESGATWTNRDASTAWQASGAKGATDTSSSSIGSFTATPSGFRSVDLPLEVVQGWVANPSSNYGLLFSNSNTFDGFSLSTSENEVATLRPTLTISFER